MDSTRSDARVRTESAQLRERAPARRPVDSLTEAARAVRREPGSLSPGAVISLQRTVGNRAVGALMKAGHRGGRSRATVATVQRKLEYAQHHAAAPSAAKAAVKADQAGYEEYQHRFERDLGVGLHGDAHAQQGADALLLLMRQAMTRAGFDPQKQRESFGVQGNKPSVDLGSVLVNDVDEALQSGNLREKMGMVYQARFRIVEALNTLRKDPREESQSLIGDEMKSREMEQAINEKKPGEEAYAVLKRRDSVIAQNEKRTKGQYRPLISGTGLHSSGIPLSEREERAAPAIKGERRFVPGKEFYTIPSDIRTAERENLRAVAAGLSGSTDMYFRIAKHLRMGEAGRRQLRLAALGQMLANQDHSYHEIMHVAKTQGELADYPDELPIGYTTLAPLDADQILAAAKLPDFPGDAQVRSVGAVDNSDQVKATGGDPSKRSHSYPAVLAKLSAYHANPSRAQLEAVIAEVDSFLTKKKPGFFSTKSTRAKWEQRQPALQKLRDQCARLLVIWDGFKHIDQRQVTAFVKQSMTGDPGAKARMGRLADLDEEHGDWYSPQFRAQTSDMSLDTSRVTIKTNREIGLTEDLNDRNLVSDLADAVHEHRTVVEALGGNTDAIPVTKTAPVPTTAIGKRQALANRKNELDAVRSNPYYQNDPDQLKNVDVTDLEAIDPQTPVGGFLKRFEGKPVPEELQALQAYAQAKYFEMMNYVLNRRANKKFMATPEGQKWERGSRRDQEADQSRCLGVEKDEAVHRHGLPRRARRGRCDDPGSDHETKSRARALLEREHDEGLPLQPVRQHDQGGGPVVHHQSGQMARHSHRGREDRRRHLGGVGQAIRT